MHRVQEVLKEVVVEVKVPKVVLELQDRAVDQVVKVLKVLKDL